MSYEIFILTHQSGSMPVSSLWRDTAWLHRLLPAITIRIKNAQITVILFTIVATKDVEFFLE